MRWFGRSDRDYREELDAHIQLEVQANLERGMNPGEARRKAQLAFGNVLAVRDALSDARPLHFWQTLGRDVSYAVRLLRRNPGLTVTAGLTLALVIGANAAIFSVVNGVLLREMPFTKPEELVLVWGADTFGQRSQISFTDMSDWRHESHLLAEIAAFQSWWNPTLYAGSRSEHAAALQVTDGYFRVMQGTPLLGRVFTPEEQIEGRNRVVVLSYNLWRQRFQADSRIVGKTIKLDSVPHTVVGVMPAGFHPLPSSLMVRSPQLYTPLAEAYDNRRRAWTHLRSIARLKPGIRPEQAQAELSAIATALARAHPDTNTGRGVHVVSLKEDVLRGVRPALVVLQGAVLAVLLAACANLTSLALARSAARQREIALRAALGASRSRLLSQLLIESILVAVVGGFTGILVASWAVALLHRVSASMLPDFAVVSMDWRVLTVSALIAILSGLMLGAAPALLLLRTSADRNLKSGGRAAGHVGRSRMRRLLVISEVALSAVLLVCAGLLLRSFVSIIGVSPGFDARDIFTAEVDLPDAKYSEHREVAAFFARVVRRLQALPGVEAASAVSILPESGKADHTDVHIEGRNDPPGHELIPDIFRVTPDYFRTLRIPIVAGRAFTEQDDALRPLVAIVNQSLARTLWPGQSAVGRRIWTGAGRSWRTVVGVAEDVRQYGLDSRMTMQFYVPHAENSSGSMTFLVRSYRSPQDVARDIRSVVRQVDAEQSVFEEATMESILSNTIAPRRVTLFLVIAFAATALLLAAIGLYGVVAYNVAQRTREFGVRTALGAKSADILRIVMMEGGMLVACGLAGGLLTAAAVTRFLATLLFRVGPNDSLTFLAVSILLSAIALLASYLPARRAMRIDPVVALRYE